MITKCNPKSKVDYSPQYRVIQLDYSLRLRDYNRLMIIPIPYYAPYVLYLGYIGMIMWTYFVL